MDKRFLRYVCAVIWAAMLTIAVLAVAARHAVAYTPKSPKVKAAVARAVAFLESEEGDDRQLGARSLTALVLVKLGTKPDHPRIVQAVEAIQKALRDRDPTKIGFGTKTIYHAGLMAMFLIAHDPDAHRADIECLLKYLQLQQKEHGGWGYQSLETGDTSMTQYGVLSAWEATQAGFEVPTETITAVSLWLMKTQDPGGGFAYQGKVSPSFAPVKQPGVTLSMTAAGLGSVYICADMLGLIARREVRDEDLPPALQRVKEEERGQDAAVPRAPIDRRLFEEVQGRGVGWMRANFQIDPTAYAHYYMYALERCMSFRELWDGKAAAQAAADGPPWYNQGVDHLIDTQKENGSWQSECGAVPDTAFGVLFLIRSTQKSIRKARNFGDGTLVGGRGLPKDTDRARVRDGKVVAEPLVGPADQLLAILEKADVPDFGQAADLVAELPPERAEELVKKHADKLRRLAGDESPQARMTAVRALSRVRDLDNVPTLIYALTDPDREISRTARDGLRRISRNPAGFGLPDRPDESGSELRVAIEKWKAWYLRVRPDAEFEN